MNFYFNLVIFSVNLYIFKQKKRKKNGLFVHLKVDSYLFRNGRNKLYKKKGIINLIILKIKRINKEISK
jgi:hypothetical protein